MLGGGSQLQAWKQEGPTWAKGLHAPLGADADKLLAGIFGSHCQVLGGRNSLGDLRGPTVSITLCRCFPRLPARRLTVLAQALLAAPTDPPASLTLSGHIESGLAASSALSKPRRSQRRADREALLGKSWACLSLAGEEPRQEGAPTAGAEQLLP